jgi:hypothetical protein
MRKLIPLALLALAFGMLFVPRVSAQAGMAQLRVVHASPDAPAVNVSVDGSTVLQDFGYGQASDYLTVPAGSHMVAIAASADPSTVVFDGPVMLADGVSYTIVAAGLLSGQPSFAPLVLTDVRSAPADGMARVEFVHVSPGTPAVDVAVAGGPVIFNDVSYGQDFSATVPAGTVDLEARLAGTSTVALPVPGATLEAGKVYTILAIGQVDGHQPLAELTLAAGPSAS